MTASSSILARTSARGLNTHAPRARRSLPPLEYELIASERRLRFAPSSLAVCSARQADGTCLEPQRLHDAIQRMGEVCLSPEIAHLMINPFEAIACLRSPGREPSVHYREMCADRGLILATMNAVDAMDIGKACARQCIEVIAQRRPMRAVRLGIRQRLLAWSVVAPARVVLFTGTDVPPGVVRGDLVPHQLPKVLLDERSRRPAPSAIQRLPAAQDRPGMERAVRESLKHYARTQLMQEGFTERIKGLKSGAHAHILEEAVVCFVHPPAGNHSTIELHESQPWEKDHIDSRCAYF